MTDREIMQQALDALKQTFQFQQTRDVIAALETALAQPEQAIGDIRALKHRIHELEGEVIGYKRILDAQDEQEPICRSDGRCQYAIDHGAEGLGHCPQGKCCMPQPEQKPVAWIYDWYGYESQSETKVLVKDWIAAVYSEVSDPTIGAHNIRPLYTAPPRKEWVGLTDEEIHKIVDACTPDEAEQEELNDFARAVCFAEAKLKEKNDGSV